MPIYEYRCSTCGQQFEAMQKITEEPLQNCPHCGAKGVLQKLISATQFQLKGEGWYVTDFKNKDDKKKKVEGEKAESKSEQTEQTSKSADKKEGSGGSSTGGTSDK